MHTSFEGKIGHIGEHGEVEWSTPKREAIEPWSTLAALSLAMAFPLAFCVAFWLFG